MKNKLFLLLSVLIILTGCPSPNGTENKVPRSSEKNITAFSLLRTENATLTEDYECDIDNSALTVAATLPYGSTTTLAPSIELSENAAVSPASGIEQDFSSTVDYVVTAEDGSTQTYRVTLDQYGESESTDSSLSNMIMYKEGSFNLDLDFDSSTTIYEISTTSSVESVRFKCTAASSLATVTAGKEGAPPEAPNSYGFTPFMDLDDGLNTFNINVTSYDQSSTTTYVIKVNKGDDLTVPVGEGWTTGLLTDDEELTENGFLWYTFPAEVGHYYQIAVDGDNESTYSDCWTPDNGGWEDSSGNGPTADPYYNVYREDGATLYDTPEQDETTITINSTSYTEYMGGDNKYYVTVRALDDNVKIKITQHESSNVTYAHTFAIQVRERTEFPEPIEVSEGLWFETSVPEVTDLWTYYDVPAYRLTMTEGVRYRVGIDDGTDTWDDDGGWNTAGCGISTEPTASQVMMQLLTPAGDDYDYEEGDSGWVDTDKSGTSDRRFATVTALDSEVYMEVDPSSSGTFAIQYRPVVISAEDITTAATWTDVNQTRASCYWEQEWHHAIPVEAGKNYRIAIDDRETYEDFRYDYCWTPENGGSANVEDAYVEYRILDSEGDLISFKESWRTPDAEGWLEADDKDSTYPYDYKQKRYLTYSAGEDETLTMEIRSILPSESGTYAIQVRELPEPELIIADDSWNTCALNNINDPWDMDNYDSIAFDTTEGTTYYLSVDNRMGYWTTANGGMATDPEVEAYTMSEPGPYGSSVNTNLDSSTTPYLTATGTGDRMVYYFTCGESSDPETVYSFGVRLSTEIPEPTIE